MKAVVVLRHSVQMDFHILLCPVQNLNQDCQDFSSLDVLDDIFELLFGIHVEGFTRLYRCQLEKRADR